MRWDPDAVAILLGAGLAHALARHPVPVPPGQRLPLPDRLRPSRTPSRCCAPTAARPTRSSSSRATATPRPGTGYRPGVEGARRATTAPTRRTRATELLEQAPRAARKRATRIYHVLGRDARVDAKLIETLETLRAALAQRRRSPPDAIVDPRAIVHEMRLFKEPAELEIMRRAAAISARGPRGRGAARAARASTSTSSRPRSTTRFRRRGGARPRLHDDRRRRRERDDPALRRERPAAARRRARADRRRLRARRLRVGRDAHLSRSAAASAAPARDVYEVVLAAQTRRSSAARPGATLPTIHDAALRVLVEGMLDARRCSRATLDELIASEAYQPFYMHRTSHWLGLDVHDVGSLPRRRRAARARAGHGASPSSRASTSRADDEKAPARFRGIGVRIEDDVRRHRRRPREPDRGDPEARSTTSRRWSAEPASSSAIAPEEAGPPWPTSNPC